MAASTPTKEPETLVAGDTWKWERSLSDYPASDSWSLTYYLRKSGSSAITITSSANVDAHLVTVAAATTASYTPGTWDFRGYVTKSGERYEVFNGILEVETNPATAASSYDPRTHAEKVIDAIEAVLESRATKEILNFSVEANSLSSIPHADLLALRSRYRIEVEREKAAERLKMGRGSGRRILTRFQ